MAADPKPKLAIGVRFTVDELTHLSAVEIVGQTPTFWRVAAINEATPRWRDSFKLRKASLRGKTVRILSPVETGTAPSEAQAPETPQPAPEKTLRRPEPLPTLAVAKVEQPATGNFPAFAGRSFPKVILEAGEHATHRFIEFFTANIRNANTRKAYARAVAQFLEWCDARALGLPEIRPFHVAAYVEELPKRLSHERPTTRKAPNGRKFGSFAETGPLDAPSVKQHLAAIRMLFDWLVVGQVVSHNPAASVRGPKHVVKRGKTTVLSAKDARRLLDSIPLTRKVRQVEVPDLVGLRDRAIIAVMVYSFARIGAVVGMKVEDYYENGRRCWIRLREKGGKFHEVPAHHNAEAYVDVYLEASGITTDSKTPLFRAAVGRTNTLSQRAMSRIDAFRMIKRRAKAAGLPPSTCCHTFRATGITAYLEAGGTIENAQAIAAHESPRTTKLYDRTSDELTLDEIERIQI